MNRKERKRFFQDRVSNDVIVHDAVPDHSVQVIIVFDLYLVQVIRVLIVRQFHQRADGLKSCEIDPDEKGDHRNEQENHGTEDDYQNHFTFFYFSLKSLSSFFSL